MKAAEFRFFIHFRKSIQSDIRYLFKPLGIIPERFNQFVFTRLSQYSFRWAQVFFAGKKIGGLQLVPMSATMMLKMSRTKFLSHMEKYLDDLVAEGVKIVGLGALTAPMTNGGLALAHRKDIVLTNGNAFTAVIMVKAVLKIIEDSGLEMPRIAVVGASGSVGACVTQLLVEKGQTNLLLVAQTLPKLEKLKANLNSQSTEIQISNTIDSIKKSNIVIVLTASDKTLINAEHLAQNAIVLDGTQPRNTCPNLLKTRPDITLIDGGLVKISNLSFKGGNLSLPQGIYFACFTETLLLALENYTSHFCLGNATLAQAQEIEAIADKYAMFGFDLAPFTAFGAPVTIPNFSKTINIFQKQSAA